MDASGRRGTTARYTATPGSCLPKGPHPEELSQSAWSPRRRAGDPRSRFQCECCQCQAPDDGRLHVRSCGIGSHRLRFAGRWPGLHGIRSQGSWELEAVRAGRPCRRPSPWPCPGEPGGRRASVTSPCGRWQAPRPRPDGRSWPRNGEAPNPLAQGATRRQAMPGTHRMPWQMRPANQREGLAGGGSPLAAARS